MELLLDKLVSSFVGSVWESNVRTRIDLGETIIFNFQLFDDQIRIALFYFRTWKLINDK